MVAPEVERLGLVWRSLDELLGSLGPADWDSATDLPGWTVKDIVSHLSGSESFFMGRPLPDHQPGGRDYVKNELGAANEVSVDFRRSRSAQEVLEEFRALTEERMKEISDVPEADMEADAWTPLGHGTFRDLLDTRLVDAWTHEQDIRRATHRPGHLEGPIPEAVTERLMLAIPYVIGKRVAPPDGTTLSFEVGDVVERSIGVEGGRANALDDTAVDPDVWIGLDVETFGCLTCGRWTPEQAAGRGRLEIRGEAILGRRVLEQMNVML